MDFFFEATLNHSVEVVYRAYRDELSAVAREVENVEGIDLIARRESTRGVEISNLWHGRGIIPKVARQLISPDMLLMDSWTTWHDDQGYSDWLVAPRHFGECGHCGGELRFIADGPARTRVTMSGELSINLESIPLVPRLMRSWVEVQVEKFLLGMGEPNHRGVARLFEDHLTLSEPTLPAGLTTSINDQRVSREHRVS